MAQNRRYPFGGYFVKESLKFSEIEPAVLAVIWERCFSNFESVFSDRFTLKYVFTIYIIATKFKLIIEYLF